MQAPASLSEQRRQLLEELLRGEPSLDRKPGDTVGPRPPGAMFPASAEQHHVWLHAAMAPDVPLYNEAITIHRHGSFSLEVLEQSLNEILRRHEIWRTSFEWREGGLWGVVHQNVGLKLPVVDISHLPELERDGAAKGVALEDARRPFDLKEAPLMRAKVVRLAPDEHRLYVTLHHIVFDGVSIYRVLMPELAALYAAYAGGMPPSLPERPLQYGDYAIWREERLAADAMPADLGYWREKLSGDLPEIRLPADRRPPATPTHRGSMETFALSRVLTASLKALSAQEGVTLYVTLLAVFKTLLHRYSGQEDIVIGGVTDMRRRPELEDVIGYFLNSLALRTRPTGDTRFRDYLGEVQRTVLEALDASNLPFDRVVREVCRKRVPMHHPLFQILFSIEPPAPAFADGWALTQMDVAVGVAKFDLYLELDEENGRIIGRFLYSTDLFEPATIQRMIGHWTTLLQGAVENPTCILAGLPLLTAEERPQILIERNDTRHDYPNTTIHDWIAERIRQCPNAVAIECAERRWSYAELGQRVSALAHALRAAGATRGTLVGIAMERSPDMVAGLLAILKAGAAYLPLDPGLPPARLSLLIEDARPAVILAEQSVLARLPPSDARVVLCATDLDGPPEESGGDGAGPDDLAYVLYTSGSTGKPKAVEIRHRSVVNLLAAVERDIGFRPDDSLLAVTTLSFDIAALELLLPLATGGRLVIASRVDSTDPARLAALLDRTGCTVMQATPATWRGLVAQGWPGNPRLRILCGGEALTSDLAKALLDRSAAVFNVYGPTETTIWSMRHKVMPDDDPVPIGRPFSNTHLYILDRNGAPVPDGVAGELMIGGDGLARGYRNDPELTRQKFAVFPSLGGERLYRTGDMARYRGNGLIEYLGRNDNQAKIRGFRVGIEEVENAIALHPRIAAAAVRATPDPSGEWGLAAYIAGDGLGAESIPELRAFLRETMPDYMVPTNYMILPALPLTPNGKIDRKQLPTLDAARPAETIAPRDALEIELADVWKKLLGLTTVGIDDNFFDLGGHSLLAAMLMAQIKAAFGRELPLIALFESPTIAGLAHRLRSADKRAFSHLVRLRASGTHRPFFIVHGIFGNVLQLSALAEQIRTTRPIYALQARGSDPEQEPHSTIAEMVDAYLATVRNAQPEGPYALAGYSFGGLVAYEMARRLRSQGERVNFMGLLETDLHERFLPWPDKLAYHCLLTTRVLAKLRTLPARALPAYFASKLQQMWDGFLLRAGLRAHSVSFETITGPQLERFQLMYRIGAREFMSFRPKSYDGKLSIFRVTGEQFDACDPMPIWRRAVAAVEFFPIGGAHGTIMTRPHVDKLAAQLSRCLAALDTPPAFTEARTSERETVPRGTGMLEPDSGVLLQG